MIVYVEGIPASGKTSVIQALSTQYSAIVAGIPEYIDAALGKQAETSHDQGYFMRNDELKWLSAIKSSKKINLVDRGHLSTLIYNLAEYKFNNYTKGLDAYVWYKNIVLKNNRLPNRYILLRNTPSISLSRRKELYDSRNMWDKEEVLDYCNRMYLELISEFESQIPITVIETIPFSLAEVIKEVKKILCL